MKRIGEISLKEKDLNKLKEYPLHDVICTESQIYYYKKDKDWNSILFKKLFVTDEKRVTRKINTIEALQDSELSTYEELIIPDELVLIGGVKSGFTIKEVVDSTNLYTFLRSKEVSDQDKILVLKKIGELLKKIQNQSQEFYFGDLQEFNFLVDKDNNIHVVDLDSSAVSRKKPLETKYIIIDKKTHSVPKYKVNSAGRCYPNYNIDNFCYNTMILNYLAGRDTHCLSFEEYYKYMDYLDYCGIPREMIDIFDNHYSNKDNESVVDYLDELRSDYRRANYKVYEHVKEVQEKRKSLILK